MKRNKYIYNDYTEKNVTLTFTFYDRSSEWMHAITQHIQCILQAIAINDNNETLY